MVKISRNRVIDPGKAHGLAGERLGKAKGSTRTRRLTIKMNVKTSPFYLPLPPTFLLTKTVEEAGRLIAVGFEYVCHHEGAMLFRKRKLYLKGKMLN